MKGLLLFIFITYSSLCKGQQNQIYKEIDTKALEIPDSNTKSIDNLASYFYKTFTTPKERVRGIFIWLAKNIQYDIKNQFVIDFYEKKEDKIKKMLITRSGICSGYSYIFEEVCTKMGIKAHTITGYTTYGGIEYYRPHAWSAAKIDSTWYVYDITWAAGHVQDDKFIAELNEDWYMDTPSSSIESHMPFDPMWQFLEYPITNEEFKSGIPNRFAPDRYFNFEDSLLAFEKMDTIQQSITASTRLEKNGVTNSLIFDRLAHYKIEIEYYKNNKINQKLNSASTRLNKAVNLYNDFINYRNHQFVPRKPEKEIRNKLLEVEMKITESEKDLLEITNPEDNVKNYIEELGVSLKNLSNNVKEQKIFLNNYFKSISQKKK